MCLILVCSLLPRCRAAQGPETCPQAVFFRSNDHFAARPRPWAQSPAGTRLPAGGFLVGSLPLQTEVRQNLPATPPKAPPHSPQKEPPVNLFPSDKDVDELFASGSENVLANVCSDNVAASGDTDEVEKDSAKHKSNQETVKKNFLPIIKCFI